MAGQESMLQLGLLRHQLVVLWKRLQPGSIYLIHRLAFCNIHEAVGLREQRLHDMRDVMFALEMISMSTLCTQSHVAAGYGTHN